MSTKILGIHETEAVEAMLAHIVAECSAVNVESRYDDMLDECFSFEQVGGIFAHMSPSRVLLECDPTAYRCGMNDWLDGERENIVEVGSDYYDNDDVNKAREEFIDGLRDELKELETELGELDLTEKDAAIEMEADKLNDQIARKESAIEACEDYTF